MESPALFRYCYILFDYRNPYLTIFTLRWVCTLVVGILIVPVYAGGVILRLMLPCAIYAFRFVGIGGSYVSVLLIVEALPHPETSVIQECLIPVRILEYALFDRLVR
jgi:hypothetical protein